MLDTDHNAVDTKCHREPIPVYSKERCDQNQTCYPADKKLSFCTCSPAIRLKELTVCYNNYSYKFFAGIAGFA